MTTVDTENLKESTCIIGDVKTLGRLQFLQTLNTKENPVFLSATGGLVVWQKDEDLFPFLKQ